VSDSKFLALLKEQIRSEFTATTVSSAPPVAGGRL
jgi:hypothetical protein